MRLRRASFRIEKGSMSSGDSWPVDAEASLAEGSCGRGVPGSFRCGGHPRAGDTTTGCDSRLGADAGAGNHDGEQFDAERAGHDGKSMVADQLSLLRHAPIHEG